MQAEELLKGGGTGVDLFFEQAQWKIWGKLGNVGEYEGSLPRN